MARSCARPGCSASAAATLRFAYHERQAVIEPLGDDRRPQTYDLCGPHAARTRPPHGWTLRDVTTGADPAAEADETDAPTGEPRAGGDRMALLAAALNAAANSVSHTAAAPAAR